MSQDNKTLLEQLASEIADLRKSKKKKDSKEFILVVNGRVVPAKVSKSDYENEVRRLATTSAKIEIFGLVGTAGTNLEVAITPVEVAAEITNEVEGN